MLTNFLFFLERGREVFCLSPGWSRRFFYCESPGHEFICFFYIFAVMMLRVLSPLISACVSCN